MEKALRAVFCTQMQNDLVRTLRQSGCAVRLAQSAEEAVSAAQPGEAVFLLADSYPRRGTTLTRELLDCAREKNLRLYVEYPEKVFDDETAAPQTILYERLIAPDGFFGAMEPGSILLLNGCWHRRYFTEGPGLLCLAKVAGYDTLAYGLPEKLDVILDWLDEKQDVLISTSCLSSFVSGRYAPTGRWRALWQALLSRMGLGEIELTWQPVVSVEAGPDEALADEAGRRAYERNLDWMYSQMITKSSPDVSVLEGWESAIDCDGKQFPRYTIRADCISETAMEMAYGWRQTGDPKYRKTGEELVNHALKPDAFYIDEPDSPTYGLINWYENKRIFYTDDNARVLLGLLSAREMLGESRWDEKILRCVLANLRTSGRDGLRSLSMNESFFEDKGWLDYYNAEVNVFSPHHQSYIWAVYLWMYELTGLEELLIKAESAIGKIMERFPDQLRWQNSLTGEIARMLLPLSFLMRVNPTDRHRRWLYRAVDALLAYQAPCGAIRDAFGNLSQGRYPPPQSNESYGTEEASLIQQNGDPATDLLYTTNWAFIGLWEASIALKDERIRAAYERLKDFLLRIQIRSERYPGLDGAWMRAFDYEKWEYWGTTADIGWSAWCVETGWVNAWISTTFMLDARGESLMKTSSKESFSAIAEDIYREMMTPKAE